MDARSLYIFLKDDGTPDCSIFSVLEHVSKSYGNPLFSIVEKTYVNGQMTANIQKESYDADSLENVIIARSKNRDFPIQLDGQYKYDSCGNIYLTTSSDFRALMVLYLNPGTGLRHVSHFYC